MEFSIKGPDPASLNGKTKKNNMVLKCFKSPKMNFKVNLFFHLYETHITPLGISIPTVLRVSDGVY